MREIKFRYIIETPPDFMHEGDPVRTIVEYHTLEELERGHAGFVSHNYCRTLARDESTGLKDKNGREVYEGDILSDNGIIEFRSDLRWDGGGSVHSGFFSTEGYQYKDDGDLSYHYQISELEVIGNITQNPELVK